MKEWIAEYLADKLENVYCHNCKYDNVKNDYCEDCHRKNMMWALSDGTANAMAENILKEVSKHFDLNNSK